ncbi:MAG: FAS1-like dehydratase domain-containing protein [Galactobacter sp.]
MSINTQLQGSAYPAAAPYQVGREKVRGFALAVGATHPVHLDVDAARAAGHADLVAAPTFAVIIAQQAEAAYITDPDSGIDFSRVVHAEERFTHHRPIVAGDEITATVHVDRARAVGTGGMVTTRTELVNAAGEPVSTVLSTLMVRGED